VTCGIEAVGWVCFVNQGAARSCGGPRGLGHHRHAGWWQSQHRRPRRQVHQPGLPGHSCRASVFRDCASKPGRIRLNLGIVQLFVSSIVSLICIELYNGWHDNESKKDRISLSFVVACADAVWSSDQLDTWSPHLPCVGIAYGVA